MKIISKILFGSHLYGTDTEKSDRDIKIVFMPDYKDILLGKVKHIVSQKKEIDSEYISLHSFISLALEGQTMAFDMLHAPASCTLETSDMWKYIVKNRSKFYTKKPRAFIGYARTQAEKYGNKGEHIKTFREVEALLLEEIKKGEAVKLKDLWDKLPKNKFTFFYDDIPWSQERKGIAIYQVCGKMLEETITLEYALSIIQKNLAKYGDRALQAEKAQGIDWKALSHAYRVASEVKELLSQNTITFPLPNRDLILGIKLGEVDLEIFQKHFQTLLEQVESLVLSSKLPEVPDVKFWEDFLIKETMEYLNECSNH